MENSFQDFDSISKEAWAKQLEKDLRGTTFEDLISKDQSDLNIHPFYTKDDLPENINPLFDHSDWSISTYVTVEKNQEEKANHLALEELGNGAQSIVWTIENPENVKWDTLFQNIQLEIIESFIILPAKSVFPKALNEYLSYHYEEHDASKLVKCFQDVVFHQLMGETEEIPSNDFEHIHIQGQEYAHLGLNSVDQVAYLLLHLQETLHLANHQGKLKDIKSIHIGTAHNTQYFEEISKLRTLYLLIPTILKEYNLEVPFYFHAETSLNYLVAEDNSNNILRNAIAGMSAVLGGCHYLYIHPHKSAEDHPEVEARRVARNQQHLFKEESYLNKIADASQGSYTIEARTKDILDHAWKLFLDIEEKGGLLKHAATFHALVLSSQENLLKQYQSGKITLIGYNKYLSEDKEATIPAFTAKSFKNNLRYFQLPLITK